MQVNCVTNPSTDNVKNLGARYERWLKERLSRRKFPGRKVAGRWMRAQENLGEIIMLIAVIRRGGADV